MYTFFRVAYVGGTQVGEITTWKASYIKKNHKLEKEENWVWWSGLCTQLFCEPWKVCQGTVG